MKTSDSWPRSTTALLGGISTSPSTSIMSVWLSALWEIRRKFIKSQHNILGEWAVGHVRKKCETSKYFPLQLSVIVFHHVRLSWAWLYSLPKGKETPSLYIGTVLLLKAYVCLCVYITCVYIFIHTSVCLRRTGRGWYERMTAKA